MKLQQIFYNSHHLVRYGNYYSGSSGRQSLAPGEYLNFSIFNPDGSNLLVFTHRMFFFSIPTSPQAGLAYEGAWNRVTVNPTVNLPTTVAPVLNGAATYFPPSQTEILFDKSSSPVSGGFDTGIDILCPKGLWDIQDAGGFEITPGQALVFSIQCPLEQPQSIQACILFQWFEEEK